MEDLTLDLIDISNDCNKYTWPGKSPFEEAEWERVKCILYFDNNENQLVFVGYIRSLMYPVYALKASVEECGDKETFSVLNDLANNYCIQRKLHKPKGSSRKCYYQRGTKAFIYNKLIELEEFNRFPYDIFSIRMAIKYAKEYAKFYSEAINWALLSKKLDEIDEKAKGIIMGVDPYPPMDEFYHMYITNYTFMMLTDNEYARSQYLRLINHWEAESLAQYSLNH